VQASESPLLRLRLDELLDELASEAPAPASGTASALVATMAAAILAMVARSSGDWAEHRGASALAETLRQRIAPLAQLDAEAYEVSLVALHLPKELEAETRSTLIGDAVSRAGQVPLAIADYASDVIALAAEICERCDPARRADVVAAALLAEGAVRAAAHLVTVNLTFAPNDPRVERAEGLVRSAQATLRAMTSE
jgi:formiminotetrahydrofolate cyclodeaminase